MLEKFATVSILGKSNVGKSTFLNRVIKKKLSIVTSKKQTTRSTIKGIVTDGVLQLVFLDNPGIFSTKNYLDKTMVKSAWSSIAVADFILLMLDGRFNCFDDISKGIFNKLSLLDQEVVVAINKADLLSSAEVKKLQDHICNVLPLARNFVISSKFGHGIDFLLKYIENKSPISPWQYSSFISTDISDKFLASEITREQLFLKLGKELPYKIKVETEVWKKNGPFTEVKQLITVSKESHRAIVIGKNGSMLKYLGQKARMEINKVFKTRSYLFIFIKVDKKWIEKINI